MADFWDLVNIEEFGEKRNYFETERWGVSFYCKDCEELVETNREKPKEYIFTCSKFSERNFKKDLQLYTQNIYSFYIHYIHRFEI